MPKIKYYQKGKITPGTLGSLMFDYSPKSVSLKRSGEDAWIITERIGNVPRTLGYIDIGAGIAKLTVGYVPEWLSIVAGELESIYGIEFVIFCCKPDPKGG